MDAGLLAQYAVIAVLVLASLGVVMRRQFPNAARRMRVALALLLLREGRPGWMQVLGRRIAPPPAAGGGACGGCGGCD